MGGFLSGHRLLSLDKREIERNFQDAAVFLVLLPTRSPLRGLAREWHEQGAHSQCSLLVDTPTPTAR